VAIKARRSRQLSESSRLFLRFLNLIDSRERQNYVDIRHLISDSEKNAYDGLSERERQVFEDRFWRQKDPDLSNEYNERQLEHFERVWIVRHEFGQDVYPWDRRGEVYIRYGSPDYRSRSGWVMSLPSAKVQEIKERAYRDLYQNPPDGELIGPVFPIRSDRSQSIVQEQEQALADQTQTTLTLEEGMQQERISGIFRSDLSQEAYAPVTAQHDKSIVPWESWVYTDVEGGLIFDFTKETGGGAGYNFAPLPPIPPSILKSAIRLSEYAPEIAYQRAVNNQPDDFRPSSALPLKTLYYDVTDFRGDGRSSRVDVSYGIPLSDLILAAEGNKPQVVIERGVALADSAYNVVYRQSKKIQLDADSQNIVDVLRQDVPPGLYHLTLTVTDVMSGRTGKLQRDVAIDDYAENRLKVSDVMLVQSLRDTVRDLRFRRGSYEVVPNPMRIFQAPQTLAFYCEVYHLKKNDFGQTHYKVTTGVKAVDKKRPMPSGPMQQPEVALSYEQVGTQDWERLPLEIDLNNAQSGTNRLVVIVEDLHTGERVARETFFEYIK
jgi:GWxTD domain-containing protein